VRLLAVVIELRVGGLGVLIMVGLSIDVFMDAQVVEVLSAGDFSVQIPTHLGDVNSQNQKKVGK
jgi:hypothetical protein